jgi:hypothetical protein
MARYKPIPKEKQDEVIEFFRKNKNNSMTAMSVHFGLTVGQIDSIINNHLKQKMPWQNKEKEERSQSV